MASDRIYLICGNCGCDNEWEWSYIEPEYLGDILMNEDVWLTCKNCSTIHSLNYYTERKQT